MLLEAGDSLIGSSCIEKLYVFGICLHVNSDILDTWKEILSLYPQIDQKFSQVKISEADKGYIIKEIMDYLSIYEIFV